MLETDDNDSKTQVQLAVVTKSLEYLTQQLDKIDQKISINYVTKEELALIRAEISGLRQEFVPFKRMVVNVLAFLGVAISGAILTAILRLVIK